MAAQIGAAAGGAGGGSPDVLPLGGGLNGVSELPLPEDIQAAIFGHVVSQNTWPAAREAIEQDRWTYDRRNQLARAWLEGPHGRRAFAHLGLLLPSYTPPNGWFDAMMHSSPRPHSPLESPPPVYRTLGAYRSLSVIEEDETAAYRSLSCP
jgi:hypothetical protein